MDLPIKSKRVSLYSAFDALNIAFCLLLPRPMKLDKKLHACYNINMEKQLVYYKDVYGKSPFLEWYNALDNSPKTMVVKRLQKVERGLYGKTRNLKQGLIELKFESGLRIYFVEDGNKIVILLCGGGKDNQSKDIKKAYEYIDDLTK